MNCFGNFNVSFSIVPNRIWILFFVVNHFSVFLLFCFHNQDSTTILLSSNQQSTEHNNNIPKMHCLLYKLTYFFILQFLFQSSWYMMVSNAMIDLTRLPSIIDEPLVHLDDIIINFANIDSSVVHNYMFYNEPQWLKLSFVTTENITNGEFTVKLPSFESIDQLKSQPPPIVMNTSIYFLNIPHCDCKIYVDVISNLYTLIVSRFNFPWLIPPNQSLMRWEASWKINSDSTHTGVVLGYQQQFVRSLSFNLSNVILYDHQNKIYTRTSSINQLIHDSAWKSNTENKARIEIGMPQEPSRDTPLIFKMWLPPWDLHVYEVLFYALERYLYDENHYDLLFQVYFKTWNEISASGLDDVDLLALGTTQFPKRIQSGDLLSLNNYFSEWTLKTGKILSDDFTRFYYSILNTNNNWYGVPYLLDTRNIYFNRTTFDTLGLQYPPPYSNWPVDSTTGRSTWTWTAFIDYADTISKSMSTSGFTFYGCWDEEFKFLMALAQQFGAFKSHGLINSTSNSCTLSNTPSFQTMIDTIVRKMWLVDKSANMDFINYDQYEKTNFTTLPCCQCWSKTKQFIGMVWDHQPSLEYDDILIANLPITSFGTTSSFLGGSAFAIPTKSSFPDIAWDILSKYLINPDKPYIVSTTTANQNLPPYDSLSSNPAFLQSSSFLVQQNQFTLTKPSNYPTIPAWSQYGLLETYKPFRKLMLNIVFRSYSTAQAIEEACDEINLLFKPVCNVFTDLTVIVSDGCSEEGQRNIKYSWNKECYEPTPDTLEFLTPQLYPCSYITASNKEFVIVTIIPTMLTTICLFSFLVCFKTIYADRRLMSFVIFTTCCLLFTLLPTLNVGQFSSLKCFVTRSILYIVPIILFATLSFEMSILQRRIRSLIHGPQWKRRLIIVYITIIFINIIIIMTTQFIYGTELTFQNVSVQATSTNYQNVNYTFPVTNPTCARLPFWLQWLLALLNALWIVPNFLSTVQLYFYAAKTSSKEIKSESSVLDSFRSTILHNRMIFLNQSGANSKRSSYSTNNDPLTIASQDSPSISKRKLHFGIQVRSLLCSYFVLIISTWCLMLYEYWNFQLSPVKYLMGQNLILFIRTPLLILFKYNGLIWSMRCCIHQTNVTSIETKQQKQTIKIDSKSIQLENTTSTSISATESSINQVVITNSEEGGEFSLNNKKSSNIFRSALSNPIVLFYFTSYIEENHSSMVKYLDFLLTVRGFIQCLQERQKIKRGRGRNRNNDSFQDLFDALNRNLRTSTKLNITNVLHELIAIYDEFIREGVIKQIHIESNMRLQIHQTIQEIFIQSATVNFNISLNNKKSQNNSPFSASDNFINSPASPFSNGGGSRYSSPCHSAGSGQVHTFQDSSWQTQTSTFTLLPTEEKKAILLSWNPLDPSSKGKIPIQCSSDDLLPLKLSKLCEDLYITACQEVCKRIQETSWPRFLNSKYANEVNDTRSWTEKFSMWKLPEQKRAIIEALLSEMKSNEFHEHFSDLIFITPNV